MSVTSMRRLTSGNSQATKTLVVVVSVFIACELPDVGVRIAVTLQELVRSVELNQDAVLYRIGAELHLTNLCV